MVATPRQNGFTYRDLLDLPEDGRRREILEGELAVSPSPKIRHQRLVGRFLLMLSRAERAGSGMAFCAPIDVVLASGDVVQPDVVFVSTARAAVITEDNIQGPPDLVVEVLSETTRRRDVLVKRRIYEQHGVPFYWVVDPEEETVRVYSLHEGRYGDPVTLDAGQRLGCPLFPEVTEAVEDLVGLG